MSDAVNAMLDALEAARLHTKTSEARMRAMWDACVHVDRRKIPGDIVECGVWRGGNIIIARKASPSRSVWMYDTFGGMPEPSDRDDDKARAQFKRKNDAGVPWRSASAKEVTVNLIKAGVWELSKINFVVGDVCETLRSHELPEQIAVLRLDTDWYASTRVELEVLWPRVTQGGIVIVDDYGHWPGCRRAVDEYFADGFPSRRMIDYTAMEITKP